MEKINCPLCGARDGVVLFKRKDLVYNISDDYFSVVRCPACDLSYVSPRPTEEEIKDFYPDLFYRTNLDGQELLHRQCLATHLKLKILPDVSVMNRDSRILDIGCSRGEFLHVMKSFGFDVYGVEFNERAVSPFDVNIFHGTLNEAAFPDNFFDVVTMWAVLEHVHNPLKLLDEIYRVLKPGGQLTLLVTNMRSVPARFMQVDDIPRHLILFSPKSLKASLEKTKFINTSLSFNHRLYGSTHSGVFTFLYKWLRGMSIQQIVEERHADWNSYLLNLYGKPSVMLKKIAKFDSRYISTVDRFMDNIGYGLNMIATAYKRNW